MSSSGPKVNCLLLAEQLRVWGKDGDWGGLSFRYESDLATGKIAVVGEEKWRNQFLMFLWADRRQAAVKLFLQDQKNDTHIWLSSES